MYSIKLDLCTIKQTVQVQLKPIFVLKDYFATVT